MERITVWTINGKPARLVHRGHRYRVNDTPTLVAAVDVLGEHPAITHLPNWSAWRFHAVAEDGSSAVFDVRPEPDGWTLLRMYE